MKHDIDATVVGLPGTVGNTDFSMKDAIDQERKTYVEELMSMMHGIEPGEIHVVLFDVAISYVVPFMVWNSSFFSTGRSNFSEKKQNFFIFLRFFNRTASLITTILGIHNPAALDEHFQKMAAPAAPIAPPLFVVCPKTKNPMNAKADPLFKFMNNRNIFKYDTEHFRTLYMDKFLRKAFKCLEQLQPDFYIKKPEIESEKCEQARLPGFVEYIIDAQEHFLNEFIENYDATKDEINFYNNAVKDSVLTVNNEAAYGDAKKK